MKLLAKCKIHSLVDGECINYKKGDYFSINDTEGKRLIELKAAVLVEITSEDGQESPPEDNSEAEEVVITEDYLNKMNKNELCTYAASIGLELNESMLKEKLISSIMDSIEEKAAFNGDDE